MYLIEKIWTDSMENEVCAAVGYTKLGYVETEQEAKDFCAKGRMFTKKDCWAIEMFGDWEQYRYSELKKLEI